MFAEYWKSVFAIAAKKAWKNLLPGTSKTAVVLAILIFGSYFVLTWQFEGSAEAISSAKDQIFVWIAPLIWLPAFYVLYLVRTPVDLAIETEKVIATLKEQLNRTEQDPKLHISSTYAHPDPGLQYVLSITSEYSLFARQDGSSIVTDGLISKCTISNDGNDVLIDVELLIHIKVVEAIPESVSDLGHGISRSLRGGEILFERDCPLRIPKLGIGDERAFVFYVHNLTEHFASAEPNPICTYKILGSETQHSGKFWISQDAYMSFGPFRPLDQI